MLLYGGEYVFMGKVTRSAGKTEIVSPEFISSGKVKNIRPVYGCTAGITSRQIEAAVINALKMLPENIRESIPEKIRSKYDIITYSEAVRQIHFPDDSEQLVRARKRFAFEEMLVFSLGLCSMKNGRQAETAADIRNDYTSEYEKLLPFSFTDGQRKAVNDCVNDMLSRKYPMSRLVQGDVGCGKTAVAGCVGYTVVKNGYQVAFMVPTEILAEQHYDYFVKLFSGTGVNTELLSGKCTAKQKRRINDAVVTGACDFLIGTHALLSDTVEFHNLGLVITDEQHRFGVSQRNTLVEKGANPHLLIMSATPIPRTLALIVYGDLDISVIDTMPKGRKPVETFLIDGKKRKRMYNFMKENIKKGHQCYIVCPAVEENELFNVAAAEQYAEKVGVDVPNATFIAVENAERFGLSQLHQLRGRVGRGSEKSYCVLISDNKNQDTQERLKTMCNTNNGFEIADKDLSLRGPGDFFGSRQHGLPEMKIADITDMSYFENAGKAAAEIMQYDPELSLSEHKLLAREVKRLFSKIGEGGFN